MQALVVVAQRELSDLLVKALHKIDFEALQVGDASAAGNAYQSQLPALVITSWGLGDLDGLAFCRELRQINPRHNPLLLIVSDRTSPADLQTILEAGADDYLLYPMESDRFRIRLQIAAQRARNRAAAATVECRLRESIERFELAVRGADEGLWDAEPAGRPWHEPDAVVWYSPRFKQLLGYTDAEFPNVLKTWNSRLHPDDRDRVFLALTKHIEQKQPYDIEYRLQIKPGEYRWFSARGQGIWDEQGRLMRMSGSLRDITQSKEDKTKLEQSEAKWRSLVENAPDIIILTDTEGVIKFINRNTEEAEIAKGRTVYHYVREPFWEQIKQAYADLRETGQAQHFELRAQKEGGGTGWYATRLGPIYHEGKLDAVVLIATDITDRKSAEQQQQESEAKWRSLVENAPNIILLADLDGTIRFINRNTPIAVQSIGRTTYDYIDEQYRQTMRDAFQSLSTTGEPQRYEVHGQTETGVGRLWYDNRMAPIWRDGRIESVVLIGTDITDRKIAEEQLERERQLLRRLTDLQERERQIVAYEIHDGLVQYLTGGLMHLEASMASDKTRKEKAQADHERGMSLLRDALAEARRLISGLRPPILDEQGVAVALEYLINESRPEIPQIQFINHSYFGRLAAPLEVAIFRITQEGLSNIRKHSHSRRARIELFQHGQWVRLIIRDWGCGFDTSKVYEERFGLQGIRQRARLLGTIATIESAPGQGTVIVVDFPLIHQDPQLNGAALAQS
jgi:PAS domain S-box-containing protein